MLKFGKVWGETSPIIATPFVELSEIHALPGWACSWHTHELKSNGFYVVSGIIVVEVRKKDYDLVDKTELYAGDFTVVPPGEEHRFICMSDAKVLELYFPEPLGSKDIIRSSIGGRS